MANKEKGGHHFIEAGHLRTFNQFFVGKRPCDALARAMPGARPTRPPRIFFEKDVPYYASTRDMTEIPGCELRLYKDWDDVAAACPAANCRTLMSAWSRRIVPTDRPPRGSFWTRALAIHCVLRSGYPVTISRLAGGRARRLPAGRTGSADFDLVLSYTGGEALNWLKTLLDARRVAPLYGSVDPADPSPCGARR